MKYIKYDDRGKQMSSEETQLSKTDAPSSTSEELLNTVEPVSFRRIFRAALVGLAVGVPLGGLVQIIRIMTGSEWDDLLVPYIVMFAAIIVSTLISFFHHKAQ